MAAGVGIEGRDAHQPMHAGFALEPAIGVFALDQKRGGFDARRRRLRFPRSVAACSRGVRPSACTCGTASRPSPGFQCRRRRHEFRDRSRCRRPRPTAWIASRSCSARLFNVADAVFRICHHGGIVFGFGHFDQARWHRPVRCPARARRTATDPASGARASVSAHPEGCSRWRGLRPWRSVHRGGAGHDPSQRCLLSRAMACWISSTLLSISARMRPSSGAYMAAAAANGKGLRGAGLGQAKTDRCRVRRCGGAPIRGCNGARHRPRSDNREVSVQ